MTRFAIDQQMGCPRCSGLLVLDNPEPVPTADDPLMQVHAVHCDSCDFKSTLSIDALREIESPKTKATMPTAMKHRAIFFFSADALAYLMTTQEKRFWRVADGIPEGARVVRAGYDPTRDKLFLVVEHESFPEVLEGWPIPEHHVSVACRDIA